MPNEALVAHVLVSKFADSLPLYRQAQMLKRQGIKLDRSTLANWVGRACWCSIPDGDEPRPGDCGATPWTIDYRKKSRFSLPELHSSKHYEDQQIFTAGPAAIIIVRVSGGRAV